MDSLKQVISEFLGKKRSVEHENLVRNLLMNYEDMGCNMSLKIYLLDSHYDFFPDDLTSVSDEHGKRFHQDIATIEKRYYGKSTLAVLGDYFWTLMNESNVRHKRKSSRISFQNDEDFEIFFVRRFL